MQILARSLDDELIVQPDSMSESLQDQAAAAFGNWAAMNWGALLRKLDRIDPSYRDRADVLAPN